MSNVSQSASSTLPGLNGAQARAWALEAGFSEAGLVELPHAAEERDAARFEEWVRQGRAGAMRYLERALEDGRLARARISAAFPWARSAVVCFSSYQCRAPLSTETQDPGTGWIARYAWSSRVDADGTRRPSDYHKVLKKRLVALEARLRAECGNFEARGYVDTGPVVERALAAAAGLGWTGKNTCLIHPRLGSIGYLAVLLTSVLVQKEETPTAVPAAQASAVLPHPDRCGACRRCIEACPTDALAVPYQMDATRCIAYLTIEHKGPIAAELMRGMGRQVFGCDICQDVCPWNRKAPISADPELEPRPELINPELEWLGSLDEKAFERVFNGSPVRRTGFPGLRRNIAIAMGNSGLSRFVPLLQAWVESEDPGLQTAARWALEKVSSPRTW